MFIEPLKHSTMFSNFSLFLSIIQFVFIHASTLSVASKEDAVNHIQKYLNNNFETVTPLPTTPKCVLSSTESCPLSSLEADKTSLVFPGGETRCIFSTSTEFSFQVIPGDKDKLLFFFQDGGACWDKLSTTKICLCNTDANPYALTGMFNRTNVENEFRSHTVVNVLYCSGDVHVGNATRDYNDKKGQPVVQSGLMNSQAVLDWVIAQQATGDIAKTLTHLFVAGSSAGSLGAQFWAPEIMSKLKYTDSSVVADSFVSFFPNGTEGLVMQDWGLCTASLLPDEFRAACNSGTLVVEEVMQKFIGLISPAVLTFIQSKEDIVQFSYYYAVALSFGELSLLTPHQFYEATSAILGRYSKAHNNLVVYLVNGDQHMYTVSEGYYNANAQGGDGKGKYIHN